MCNEWLRPENFSNKIRVFSRSKHANFTSKWDFFVGGGATKWTPFYRRQALVNVSNDF